MLLPMPHLWIPPERPAIVRPIDLSGLPHPWSLAEARDDARRGVFPFPFFMPTQAQGGNDSFTKILLHFDGTDGSTTITDSNAGGSAHTWTNHTGSIATAQSKFGGSSYAAGWVDTSDHADFTLGSNNFTIDTWFYRSGGDGALRFMCGQCDSGQTITTRTCELLLLNTNVVYGQGFVGSSPRSVTGTTTFTSTGWHHAALVRTGNTLKLFVDGTQEGGDGSLSGTVNDSANKYSVGRDGEFALQQWNGYLDEFRLSVGIARWTSNFTPSIQPYS